MKKLFFFTFFLIGSFISINGSSADEIYLRCERSASNGWKFLINSSQRTISHFAKNPANQFDIIEWNNRSLRFTAWRNGRIQLFDIDAQQGTLTTKGRRGLNWSSRGAKFYCSTGKPFTHNEK